MVPTHSGLYLAYIALRNAVVGSNKSLASGILYDGGHLRLRQFSRRTIFAAWRSTMSNFIGVVILGAIPPKVIKAVISRVAVKVATLHSWRPFTNKSLHYQCVRPGQLAFSTFPQREVWPFVSWSNCWGFYLAAFCVSNAAQIRNVIDAFVSNDIAPTLHDNLRLVRGES